MHFLYTPILTHLFSPSCLSHPIFTFLWLLLARSWHVGLSGPLIMWKFAEKMPDARPGHPFCASLRSRNAHGHVTRDILCGNLEGKMPNATDTTSIEHWALTLTVKTPQCGHTVWGKMCIFHCHVWLPGSDRRISKNDQAACLPHKSPDTVADPRLACDLWPCKSPSPNPPESHRKLTRVFNN